MQRAFNNLTTCCSPTTPQPPFLSQIAQTTATSGQPGGAAGGGGNPGVLSAPFLLATTPATQDEPGSATPAAASPPPEAARGDAVPGAASLRSPPVPAAPQRRGSGQQPALRGCSTHPARPLQGRAAAAPRRVPQPQPQPGGRHVQGAPAAGGRHLGAARAHQRLGPLPARRLATGPYHCRGARGGEEKKGRKGNGRDSAAGRTTAE